MQSENDKDTLRDIKIQTKRKREGKKDTKKESEKEREIYGDQDKIIFYLRLNRVEDDSFSALTLENYSDIPLQ
jgi:hypothetical protein